ncbi:(2Fe-2S)-binding protein [Mesorhizobium sp. Cs1321R2N1]|uniref:(2Fe-2S)-binding protein n=1 Tax=Mesorhizobium sp. Cs1321R2N1 TaxID=3015174 RepID=UPI00301C3D91
MSTAGRIVRLAERDRAHVRFFLDGEMRHALAGDTVLTAMLASGHALRKSEFGSEPRAGFCLMGACQDCWIWQEEEEKPRLRACTTLVAEGLRLRTTPPESWP